MTLLHRIQARLGRRGMVLAIYSLVFLLTGIKSIADPAEDQGRFMLYTLLPPIVRFIIWTIPAILGIIAAVSTSKFDAYAYAALTIPPVVICVSYIGSEIGFFLGYTDYNAAWVRLLQWLLLLVLLFVTSGWKETEDLPKKDK